MTQKHLVVLEDDLVGGEAVETVTFGLDGQALEIDLNEENATRLRSALAEYVAHARKAGSGARAAAPRPRSVRSAPKPPTPDFDPRAVREWAEEHGLEVSHRGRLSKRVIEAYRSAAS
jgi:hypothetical protein